MPYDSHKEVVSYRRGAKQRKMEYVRQAKDRPCLDCGQTYPTWVMQFDHVRGTKLDDLSRLARDRVGWAKLRACFRSGTDRWAPSVYVGELRETVAKSRSL